MLLTSISLYVKGMSKKSGTFQLKKKKRFCEHMPSIQWIITCIIHCSAGPLRFGKVQDQSHISAYLCAHFLYSNDITSSWNIIRSNQNVLAIPIFETLAKVNFVRIILAKLTNNIVDLILNGINTNSYKCYFILLFPFLFITVSSFQICDLFILLC